MKEGDSITINQIYEEIIKVRKELKEVAEASEDRIILKIDELNNRINKIEKENEELKSKYEFIERNQRKNNILIFGLKKEVTEISPNFICDKLNHTLELDLTESDLNDVYILGRKEKSPIKVEFVTNLKKKLVMKSLYKLKGTDISIAHDLTVKQRQEQKVLKQHLYQAKQAKNVKCSIKQNKLHLNDNIYTVEELKGVEDFSQLIIEARLNSAPGATTLQNYQNKKVNEANEQENVDLELATISPNSKKTGTIKKNTMKMTTRHRTGTNK